MSPQYWLLMFCVWHLTSQGNCWQDYDSRAYSQCYAKPKALLYGGGILINADFDDGLKGWSPYGNCALQLRMSPSSYPRYNVLESVRAGLNFSRALEETGGRVNWFVVATNRSASYNGPSQLITNLTSSHKYSVSAWLQVNGAVQEVLIKATLSVNGGEQYVCVGTVIAQRGCWSFLKGGFSLDNFGEAPIYGRLYFETMTFVENTEIWLDRASVQPFSKDEWRSHQITQNEKSRRTVRLYVVESKTRKRLHNVNIQVVNVKLSFPFGSAVARNILTNQAYERWFVKRFNTAVFENELKWYSTEREAGKVNYNVADAMVAWCEAQRLNIRGHNIVWDDPRFQQPWVKALAGKPDQLRQAVMSRVNSLVPRYVGHFIAWDVNNEQLHFSFYEDALNDSSFSTSLFLDVQRLDPGTKLFVNDYNTLENCNDPDSTPDAFILKLRQLQAAGVTNLAIGLEAHFTRPDVAYVRSTLDKLATLGLPIWLTELDINVNALPNHNITQGAIYLEDVLREAFSHPAVQGIVMWTAWKPSGCYRMCLTDDNMDNLATGDVVDILLHEWQHVDILAQKHGSLKWRGPPGTHKVSIQWNNTTYYISLHVKPGRGTQYFIVELPSSFTTVQMQASSSLASYK